MPVHTFEVSSIVNLLRTESKKDYFNGTSFISFLALRPSVIFIISHLYSSDDWINNINQLVSSTTDMVYSCNLLVCSYILCIILDIILRGLSFPTVCSYVHRSLIFSYSYIHALLPFLPLSCLRYTSQVIVETSDFN